MMNILFDRDRVLRERHTKPKYSYISPRSAFCLTIAASDPTCGAGIQADLRTFEHFGVRGVSAITAVTAQNSEGVTGVWPVSAEALEAQLNALSLDHDIRVVKIGALVSAEAVHAVAEFLRGGDCAVILDPVVNPTRGAQLTSDEAVQAMREELFPLTTLLTPNIPEAERLLDRKIASFEDMSEAVRSLAWGGHPGRQLAVLLKGGHLNSDTVRDLYHDGEDHWFESPRIDAELHGSGCTLASGIAAGIAKGEDIITAITNAREYVRELLVKNTVIARSPEGRRSNPHRFGKTVEIASSGVGLLAMTLHRFF